MHNFEVTAELALRGQVPADWTRIGQDRGLASTQLGSDPGIEVPTFFGAWESNDHAVLILGEVQGAELGDCLVTPSRAQLIALTSAMARFHRRWQRAALPTFLPGTPPLTRDWFGSRRATFLAKYGDRLKTHVLEELMHIESTYAEARAVLADCPHVIVHGDLHLDNILFRRTDQTPVLLDWSRVRRGPFAIEVARLLDSIAPASMIDELVDCYLSENPGVAGELERHLPSARKINFISSTCGMANFVPGSDREQALIDQEFARL